MPRPINYQHLRYFWVVAREGSITRATGKLNLTQPAISAQLRKLQRSLGEKLFEKSGRNLVLTEAGRIALKYADEIFGLGNELTETLAGRPTGKPMRLAVGVSESMPKILTRRLLEPALSATTSIQLVVREDTPARLAMYLIEHEVDLMLSDAPLTASHRGTTYNHLLGECAVTFFAAPTLASKYKGAFPSLLNGAPFLLPGTNAAIRRSLDTWFANHGIEPQIVGEIDDSALLKAFGQAGAGVFAAPSAIAADIKRQYRVEIIGRASELTERFYAISVERKITHPFVKAISDRARSDLFGIKAARSSKGSRRQ